MIIIVEVSDEEPGPVVRMQDEIIHTIEKLECDVPGCICHPAEAIRKANEGE